MIEFLLIIPTETITMELFIPGTPVDFIFEIPNAIIQTGSSEMWQKINIVSGDIDGSNTDFVLEHEATDVYRNGELLEESTDYTKIGSGNLTVRFARAPFFDMDDATNTEKIQFRGNF